MAQGYMYGRDNANRDRTRAAQGGSRQIGPTEAERKKKKKKNGEDPESEDKAARYAAWRQYDTTSKA